MCARLRTWGELPISRGSSPRVELRVWVEDRARYVAAVDRWAAQRGSGVGSDRCAVRARGSLGCLR